jgi:hypothetical protein
MLGLSGCPEQTRIAANHDGDGDSSDSTAASASSLDESATPTLIDVVALESLDGECATGGVEIRAGKDTDGDGALAAVEVERVARVCNGQTGATGADGDHGANGADGSDGRDGTDGSDGHDGSDGADGADGQDGSDGADGHDGANGSDGVTSLVRVVAAAPSAACPAGGSTVETGIDGNGDGSLADDEVDSSALICNGVRGEDGEDAVREECTIDRASGEIRVWCASGVHQVEAGPLTPVKVSASSISGNWEPSLAQWPDENGWMSDLLVTTEEHWLHYDFGTPALLTRVRAYARKGLEGDSPTIQGSRDGVTWTDLTVLGEENGFEQGPWAGYSSVDQPISTDVAYRYVRLHFEYAAHVYYAWLAFDGALID